MSELSVDIKLNQQQAVAASKQLGDAFARTADDLEDVGRDASKAGDKISASFDDAARDAKTAGDKMERSLEGVEDKAKGAGKKVGNELDDGFKKAGKGADDFKSEAASTARESAASFDGSAESIGDTFQELAANAFSGFGPAASIAGVAVAAGMGQAVSAITTANEATDDARDSMYEYALSAGAAGGFADLTGRINDLAGSVEGLRKIQDIATISGWEQQDVLKALATGDGLPALTEAYNEGANSTQIATNRSVELQGVLDGTRQGLELAATGAQIQAGALYDLATASGVATGEVDDLGNAVLTMPDGKQVVINAETQQAYVDVDAFEKVQVGTKYTTVKVEVDDSAVRAWQPPVKFATVYATPAPGRGIMQWDGG